MAGLGGKGLTPTWGCSRMNLHKNIKIVEKFKLHQRKNVRYRKKTKIHLLFQTQRKQVRRKYDVIQLRKMNSMTLINEILWKHFFMFSIFMWGDYRVNLQILLK